MLKLLSGILPAEALAVYRLSYADVGIVGDAARSLEALVLSEREKRRDVAPSFKAAKSAVAMFDKLCGALGTHVMFAGVKDGAAGELTAQVDAELVLSAVVELLRQPADGVVSLRDLNQYQGAVPTSEVVRAALSGSLATNPRRFQVTCCHLVPRWWQSTRAS